MPIRTNFQSRGGLFQGLFPEESTERGDTIMATQDSMAGKTQNSQNSSRGNDVKFVLGVRDRPCLYAMTTRNYRNAREEIAEITQIPVTPVVPGKRKRVQQENTLERLLQAMQAPVVLLHPPGPAPQAPKEETKAFHFLKSIQEAMDTASPRAFTRMQRRILQVVEEELEQDSAQSSQFS